MASAPSAPPAPPVTSSTVRQWGSQSDPALLVNEAETSEALVAAWNGMRAGMDDGNVPLKTFVIDLANYKRGVAPQLWTREVAAAFGAVLVGIDVRGNPGPPPPDGGGFMAPVASVSARTRGRAQSINPLYAIKQAEESMADVDSPQSAALGVAASASIAADLTTTKKGLFRFSLVLTILLLVLVLGSAVAGRQFGGYFVSNICAALVACAGVYITVAYYPTLAAEVRAHEVFFLVVFTMLCAGFFLGFIFLFQIPDRVDSFCRDDASSCEGRSLSSLKTAALIAATVGMIMITVLVTFFLRFADKFITTARLAASLESGQGPSVESKYTKPQVWIARNLMPSKVCCARCLRRRGGGYDCRIRISDRSRQRMVMAFCLVFCLAFMIIPVIVCEATDNAFWCVLSVFSRIVCSMLARNTCF